jgi:hypothetical protein
MSKVLYSGFLVKEPGIKMTNSSTRTMLHNTKGFCHLKDIKKMMVPSWENILAIIHVVTIDEPKLSILGVYI